MKKIKSIITLLISLALLLSILMQISFAAVTVYTGESAPRGKNNISLEVNVPGMAGKKTDDVVYSCGSGIEDQRGICISWLSGSKRIATSEFQFMIPTGSTKINSYAYVYNESGSHKAAKNFFTIEAGKPFGNSDIIENDRWYTLALEFPADGSYTAAAYLNGVSVGDITLKSPNTAPYGYRRIFVGSGNSNCVYFDNEKDYIDVNLNENYSGSYSTDTLNLSEMTPSKVSISDKAYIIENETITVPYGTTVAELLNAVTTTDGSYDYVRIYTDSTMKLTAEENSEIDGTMLVVAATNGTGRETAYSYYSVIEAEPDADVLKGKATGDIYLDNNTTEPVTVVETAYNVYGKASEDSVYKITNNNGAAVNLAQCLLGKNTFSKGTGALEFSFALPAGSSGFTMTDSTGHTETSSKAFTNLTFDTNGIWSGSSMQNCIYSGLEAEKWYNIAIEMGTDGSNTFNIYLNGTQVYEGKSSSDSWYGFRTAFIKMKDKNGGVMYLDNISASKSYNNANNVPAQVSGNKFITKNGKFLALNGIAVADINLAENNAYRLYNSDWSVAPSFEDAEIIVFTAKNGRSMERTYTYYNVDCSDCIIDYELSGKSGSEKLTSDIFSNTEGKLVVAYYSSSGTVLEGVVEVPATLTNGIYTASITDLAVNSSYSYRIFAWRDTDDTAIPLAKSVKVK